LNTQLPGTAVAATQTRAIILPDSSALPIRTIGQARLAFVVRRGVPLARAGLIAVLAFGGGR
jgi:hypothetical protein